MRSTADFVKGQIMIPLSGVEPEVLHFWQAPRCDNTKKVMSFPHHNVVPRIWICNILKHRALTSATASSPVTSHTQNIPGSVYPPCPSPAKDYTGRPRGSASTELLDFFTHRRVTHLPSMPALLLTGLPPAPPPLRWLPCMCNWT